MSPFERFSRIFLGIVHGLWDSICGMKLLLHIDAEIHKLKLEKEAELERRSLDRGRRTRRSPSPIPSSAAAMERLRRENSSSARQMVNADERSIESLQKKPKPAEEKKPRGEKKIAKQVLKCCLLNGGFTWLSIILFDRLLLPSLKFLLTLFYGQNSEDLTMIWGWLQSILSIIFGFMWVLPIFVLSKIVSSLWFADIANAAYRVRKGRPQMIPNISKLVADFLFSIVVQALFLVQCMIMQLLPIWYFSDLICFIHLCLLYSLYSFEYKWFNMGWELHRRLSYIENNWPYFLGFGIPLTLLTKMGQSIIASSCIFSIFFPLFILSGNEAQTVVGTTDTPLRLFSPVIFVSNLFFNRSELRSEQINSAKIAHQQQHQQQQKRQLQQQILQQQQQEFLRRRESVQQTDSDRDEHISQRISISQYRYPQPPPLQPQLSQQLRSSHNNLFSNRSTPERNVIRGGVRQSFIPTIVPGASASPLHKSKPPSAATAHRR